MILASFFPFILHISGRSQTTLTTFWIIDGHKSLNYVKPETSEVKELFSRQQIPTSRDSSNNPVREI